MGRSRRSPAILLVQRNRGGASNGADIPGGLEKRPEPLDTHRINDGGGVIANVSIRRICQRTAVGRQGNHRDASIGRRALARDKTLGLHVLEKRRDPGSANVQLLGNRAGRDGIIAPPWRSTACA